MQDDERYGVTFHPPDTAKRAGKGLRAVGETLTGVLAWNIVFALAGFPLLYIWNRWLGEMDASLKQTDLLHIVLLENFVLIFITVQWAVWRSITNEKR